MKNHTFIFMAIVLLAFAGCGDDDPKNANNNNGANNSSNNNGSNNDSNNSSNGTNSSNNGSNGSNNASNNATNNTTNNGTTTGTGGGLLDDIVVQYQDLICDLAYNCSSRQSAQFRQFVGSRFANEADCKAGEFGGIFLGGFVDNEAGIAAGRLQYDADAVDACLTKIRETGCDGVFEDDPPECDLVFTGLVAEGDACAINEECVAGLDCDSGNSCDGTCEAPEPSCGAVDCAEDEFCDPNDMCRDKRAAGETCQVDEQCVEGAWCLDTAQGANQCTVLGSVADGSACSQDEFCGSSSICDEEICVAISTPAAGEACGFQDDDCEAGTICGDFDLQTQMGTCVPAKATGEDCVTFFQCQWGLDCVGVDLQNLTKGTCMPTLADGETCDNGFQCESLNCEQDTCGAPIACLP